MANEMITVEEQGQAPRMEHGVTVAALKTRLADLLAEVKAQAVGNTDVTLPMREASFVPEAGGLSLLADGQSYPLVGNALPTLCGQLDLSAGFINQCWDRGLGDHAALTLSAFLADRLEKKPDYTLVARTRHTPSGRAVRAFVSEGYGKFDNDCALEMLVNTLPASVGEVVPLTTYASIDDLKGTILLPETKVTLEDGDYYVGLYYKNSEVLRSSFGVSPFLFRGYCTNTAVWGKRDAGVPTIHVNHYGKMDLDKIQGQLAAGIQKVVERGPNLLKLLGYAEKSKVTNPQETILYISRQNRLRVEEVQATWRAYEEEPYHQETGAGVLHAFTRAAKEFDAQHRLWMEELGAELLGAELSDDLKTCQRRWGYHSSAAHGYCKNNSKVFTDYFGEN